MVETKKIHLENYVQGDQKKKIFFQWFPVGLKQLSRDDAEFDDT